MSLRARDGSKVGTLTNSSGTLVTRPTLVTGSAKQSKGERAPDGSKYMSLVEEAEEDVPYTAQAVHFDGLTYLINDSLVATSASVLSWSGWIKMPSNTPTPSNPTVWESSPDVDGAVYAQFATGFGKLSTPLHSLPSGESVVITTTDAYYFDGGWHHFLYSGTCGRTPMESNAAKFYVDGVLSATGEAGGTPFDLLFNGKSFYVGNDTSDNPLTGDLCDLWIAPGISLLNGSDDIALSTIHKFITAGGKPVSLGDNGQLPTGTAPAVFLSGGTTAFVINQGTGGAFTLTGTLTDATTSPSD